MVSQSARQCQLQYLKALSAASLLSPDTVLGMASEHDPAGRALRGSECQMQLFVNAPQRRGELEAAVLGALPTIRETGATRLEWRSPLAQPLLPGDKPFHEYKDGKVLD